MSTIIERCEATARAAEVEPNVAAIRAATSMAYEMIGHVRSARALLDRIGAMGLGVDAEGKTAKALLDALGESGDLSDELEELEYDAGMTADADAQAAKDAAEQQTFGRLSANCCPDK